MLKKFIATTALIVIMSLSFTAAAAAAEVDAQVSVYFDDELMEFEVEPFIENGSTQVPFRPIFEKLGLTIGWDPETKKVTGEKEGLSIEMQIGNKMAIVNGEEKTLAVAPVIKNGFTFIPLRFVIENSDKEVSWDGYLREVYIADTEQQIDHLIEKHYYYNDLEDVEAVLSTIDPTSPAYEQTGVILEQMYSAYDLQTEVQYAIVDLGEDEAIVQTTQLTTRLSGPEFQDNETTAQHLLVKVNGNWRIYSSKIIYVDYLKQDLAAEGQLLLSDADQQAIRDVLEASRIYNQLEDWEAVRSLYMADFPNLDLALEQSQQIFDAYSMELHLNYVEFLSGAGNEAKVKYSMLLKQSFETDVPDVVSENVATFKKDADGKWKFASWDVLALDYRVETIEAFPAE